MSDRPDLDEAVEILQKGGFNITGGKYAPAPEPKTDIRAILENLVDPNDDSLQYDPPELLSRAEAQLKEWIDKNYVPRESVHKHLAKVIDEANQEQKERLE